MLSGSQLVADGRVTMRVLIALAMWLAGSGAALACSPIEAGSCDVREPMDTGLLAQFEAICPEGLLVEEFAVTPGSLWIGLEPEVWVLNPAHMSCKGNVICDGTDCAIVVLKRLPTCADDAPCWTRVRLSGQLLRAPNPYP